MKALSIHPYYTIGIAIGDKKIELRTWKTDYRGDILICSTAKKIHGLIPSHALCVVELTDIVPFTKSMCRDAVINKRDFEEGLYAWKLSNPRLIKPIPVKGKLSLWNFEDEEKIEFMPPIPKTYEEQELYFKKLWGDIII